jgi:hypothetical protein
LLHHSDRGTARPRRLRWTGNNSLYRLNFLTNGKSSCIFFVVGEKVLVFVDELTRAFVNYGGDWVFEKLLRKSGRGVWMLARGAVSMLAALQAIFDAKSLDYIGIFLTSK